MSFLGGNVCLRQQSIQTVVHGIIESIFSSELLISSLEACRVETPLILANYWISTCLAECTAWRQEVRLGREERERVRVSGVVLGVGLQTGVFHKQTPVTLSVSNILWCWCNSFSKKPRIHITSQPAMSIFYNFAVPLKLCCAWIQRQSRKSYNVFVTDGTRLAVGILWRHMAWKGLN